MAKSPEQAIAMMVDAAQPHCDEPVQSAMVCSHAGSMKNLFVGKLSGFGGGQTRTSELPTPLMIAVGQDTVYALEVTTALGGAEAFNMFIATLPPPPPEAEQPT